MKKEVEYEWNCIDKCQGASIDFTSMITIMITMAIIKLNKKDYDNYNNTMKQSDNNMTLKQIHIIKQKDYDNKNNIAIAIPIPTPILFCTIAVVVFSINVLSISLLLPSPLPLSFSLSLPLLLQLFIFF